MTPEPSSTPQEAKLPPGSADAVRLAKEDLARRLDVSPEDVQVVSIEAVQWPDTSLGCPQPGMMYAQVITPGFRVLLEAEGETYQYHTDRAARVVLCQPDGAGQAPSRKGITDNTSCEPAEPIEPDSISPTPRH